MNFTNVAVAVLAVSCLGRIGYSADMVCRSFDGNKRLNTSGGLFVYEVINREHSDDVKEVGSITWQPGQNTNVKFAVMKPKWQEVDGGTLPDYGQYKIQYMSDYKIAQLFKIGDTSRRPVATLRCANAPEAAKGKIVVDCQQKSYEGANKIFYSKESAIVTKDSAGLETLMVDECNEATGGWGCGNEFTDHYRVVEADGHNFVGENAQLFIAKPGVRPGYRLLIRANVDHAGGQIASQVDFAPSECATITY